ncbi:bifunctional serine/threonine-protein kinase/universal stress protein [Xinfangfangia sp. CPCC 101601]|uniref:Bifunctional serine/threonine-protein kinase/universal stress protein n=1 Tax=Pseudogemmobacter lacusdianii TaxID=3069608 RepID=A0ABU0VUT3_9RHOB|nr:bifunctional serine/threonine-protein kinase/universal stress protein [Xinfangfangia sp. CPCC 101601]MDQ2065423.1 bifunctional serine/threonine-protein kinase/universal stress protein [Xinfangfangia sp. CPCC 101601]
MIRPYQGLQIDGFTLGAQLHKGGFATIWEVSRSDGLAQDLPMVMKVPTILDGDDGPTIVGFEVEQMIMPRLSGPHVPKVIGLGDFDVMPYIVTEKIQGGSFLETFLRAPLPISEAVEIIAKMVQAVADLHRQKVIHLDLKPENFLQRASGEMVLVDYGLSRHAQLPDLLAEEFRIPMGTYPYIAPEQYLRCRDDPRSDLFALGVLLYGLCTGKQPFGTPETLRGVRKRLWRDPVPPRLHRPEIPEWLQEVILHALEVDPLRRYQSAAQMGFDLAHPAQVQITARGRKVKRDGWLRVFDRWRALRKMQSFRPADFIGAQIASVPIIVVAVDLTPEGEKLANTLRRQIKRMLVNAPDARIACVNVIKTARLGIDQMTDADGQHLHVQRLLQLRAWGDEIALPQERLTFSVLEGSNPAQAIIDFATQNMADHIVMGARGSSTARRYLGSVSAQVVAEAACSVTVVRLREGQGAPLPKPVALDQPTQP